MAKRADLETELKQLVTQGDLLVYALAEELGKLGDETTSTFKEAKIKLPSFRETYDPWYSVALRLVSQVLPDRLEDFILQYKDPKRKDVTHLTYTISDYLIGLEVTRGYSTVVDGSAALMKMQRQKAILESTQKAFGSYLSDLTETLQADMFDSELDSAAELARRGFIRGGGAIAGVVLERHLSHVCASHGLKWRKKSPTINDFNQLLKDNGIIDTAKWRFIQHLGDLRNICDHSKDREPTKEDVAELVEGVEKTIKTVS